MVIPVVWHLCEQQARLLLCQEILSLSKVSLCPDEINYSYHFQIIKAKQERKKNINLCCLIDQVHFGQYGGGTTDTDLGQTLFKNNVPFNKIAHVTLECILYQTSLFLIASVIQKCTVKQEELIISPSSAWGNYIWALKLWLVSSILAGDLWGIYSHLISLLSTVFASCCAAISLLLNNLKKRHHQTWKS